MYRNGIPFWYKALDDALIVLFLTGFLVVNASNNLYLYSNKKYSLVLASFVFVFVSALILGNTAVIFVVKSFFILASFGLFFITLPRAVVLYLQHVFYASVFRTTLHVIYLYFALQVIIFATIGKPPVLSWSDDFSRIFDGNIIRFGGLASSPNEMIIFTLILTLLVASDGKKKLIYWFLTICVMLLAKSDSGYGLFGIIIAFRFPVLGATALFAGAAYVFFNGVTLDPGGSTLFHLRHLFLVDSVWQFIPDSTHEIGKNETMFTYVLDNLGILQYVLLVGAFLSFLISSARFALTNFASRKKAVSIFLIFVSCLFLPSIFYYPLGFLFMFLLYEIEVLAASPMSNSTAQHQR